MADPFPSDHRGVVSTFSVEPADTPTLVAVDRRRLTVGDELHVVFHAPGREAHVTIVPAGVTPHGDDTGGTGSSDGLVTLSTKSLDPGAYEVALVSTDGIVLSRSPFWVYEPGAGTEVAVTGSSAKAGDPIRVTWRNAPGNRWDWLGIFKATTAAVPTDGSIPDDSGDYLLYEYTDTAIEGKGSFSKASQEGSASWPLPPGRYEVRLMLDDGYRTVARSQPFTVVAP